MRYSAGGGFHDRAGGYKVTLGNYTDQFDHALGSFASEKAKALQMLKGKSPKEQKQMADQAIAALKALPPVKKQQAEELLRRAGTPVQLGTGAASTMASVANIIATVGSIGIAVYGMKEQREQAKRDEKRKKEEFEAQRRMMEEQIKADERRQEMEQQIALERAKQGLPPAGAPSGGSMKLPGGLDPKILMIAGGALVAVLLIARK